MRISLLILLLNALIFTQLSAAADDDAKLKGALLKAMKKHDTATVKALADGGHESIDRDDVLQIKIYEYLDAERQRVIQAKEKAAADAAARKAAEEKAKADRAAKVEAEKKAAAAAAAAKAAEPKKKKESAAAKKAAEEKAAAAAKRDAEAKAAAAAVAAKKAAEEKKRKDAQAAKKAKEEKARKARAAEQKRQKEAAAKKAAEKKRKAAAAAKKKAAAKKAAAAKPAPVPAPKTVAVPAAAAAVAVAPLSVSDKELVGTWKQISSEKVITLSIEENRNFVLEQIEDDGTLKISGTWKSEENIFMMSIKKVQRNVHSRETDIHRIYKIDRLSNHRFVLLDKRNRIAYDLKR